MHRDQRPYGEREKQRFGVACKEEQRCGEQSEIEHGTLRDAGIPWPELLRERRESQQREKLGDIGDEDGGNVLGNIV